MDYLLQVFKALANDRRLRILELLLDKGELHIENMASELKIPLATCCRNLKILEKTYIISSRRNKGHVLYKLNKPDDHIYNKRIFELIRTRRTKKNQ